MTQINITRPLICILGATATGKTRLGVSLAKQFNGEILSADSRQVYRGLDIGTGKDLDEYGDIQHHLIDIIDADEEYNLFQFVSDFNHSMDKICQSDKLPILVGGTGMYLDAILNAYKLYPAETGEELERIEAMSDSDLRAELLALAPKQHNTTDLVSRSRIIQAIAIAKAEHSGQRALIATHSDTLVIGLSLERESVRNRITLRLKNRLDNGMIEEAEQLHKAGLSWEKMEFLGLEYRYMARFLRGQLNYNDMFQKLNSAIHQFAKQQEKWFRNIEKKGINIHWLNVDANLDSNAEKLVHKHLISAR